MALLENLIVEPALYQYDTGPEAQVGDQVQMFLDQEANPGFPEYIYGIIQHPITKVNCDTATSYNITYDVADLIVPDASLVIGDVLGGMTVIGQIQVVADELDDEIADRIQGDLDAYDNFLQYSDEQSLTPAQKEQVLENSGIQPVQLDALPTESSGTITGTLVPDATGSFFPIENLGGYPAFASAGYPSSYPHQLFTYTGISWLLRHYIAPGVYASWISNDISLVTGPDPGESTGWVPGFSVGMTAATGIPTVSYTYGTEAYLASFGEKFYVNTGTLIAPIWQEVLPAQNGTATDLDITNGTLTDVDIVNATISGGLADGLELTNPTETVVNVGASGATETLVLTSGTFQTVTLTDNCVFTMPTATAGKSLTLKVLSGAGSFTAAFTGVKWPGASAPTITATASKFDMLQFKADGTSWIGQVLGQNYTA
jgi:hypothetical protein